MKKILTQGFRFIIIGGFTTTIDFVFLLLFTEILSIPYFVSYFFSFTISLIVNYYLSTKFVFKIRNNCSIEQNRLMFSILSFSGLGLNQCILITLTHFCKIYYGYSKIIAVLIVMIWNFASKKIFFERINV